MTDSRLRHAADTLRGLAMDAVERASSGHPGMPMGMADAAVVLWSRFLRFDPDEPDWPGRDRFVLSAGHGSLLLYGLLHLAGYDVTLDDLKAFRQLGSRTPGHPEWGHTAGVETTTGPLGQGFGNGVGMALAAKMAAARFACPLLGTRVFGIVSDGDLMEGVTQEAASLAGHLRLDNLVCLYDDNHITIDGSTALAYSDDAAARFAALGWWTTAVDGHDMAAVDEALTGAVAADRPALIVCRTHIARGSPGKQDTAGAHGAPLGADEVARTKEALGLPAEEFFVHPGARALLGEAAHHGAAARMAWEQDLARWRRDHPEEAETWAEFRARWIPGDLADRLAAVVRGRTGATRALSGQVIQRAAELVPSLVGGSADLEPSTKTRIEAATAVAAGDHGGRNVHFGVREHAMGAVLSGMALWGGYLPMGSTFLVFSDYMRPSIRLAALMGLPVTYVFTHDSLMVGEDGPTHQPVEQVASLRLIPGLHVWRPGNATEVAAAWASALSRRDGPTAMCLTRQKVGETTDDLAGARRGGYTVTDGDDDAVATLLASGAELELAVAASVTLRGRGIPVRVVSVPCLEVFLAQDEGYRRAVLGTLPRFAVEMGRPESWAALTGDLDRVHGLSRFGASGPHAEVAAAYGFTAEDVADRVTRIVSR